MLEEVRLISNVLELLGEMFFVALLSLEVLGVLFKSWKESSVILILDSSSGSTLNK